MAGELLELLESLPRGMVEASIKLKNKTLCFMSHHAERISLSLSLVRGVNRAIRSHLATLSARLARARA